MNQDGESLKKELKLMEDETHISYLNPYPVTPGTVIIEPKIENNLITSIFQMRLIDYKYLLMRARDIAKMLCKNLPVRRCALVTEPSKPLIKVIPLHGLGSEWNPVICKELEFHEIYPGYCNSKNGPRLSDAELNDMLEKLRSGCKKMSYEFFGETDDQNLFARIVRGEETQWRIWEDAEHVAFLTPFANTPGFTVLVPRAHLSSDILSLESEHYEKLIEAAYTVSAQICSALSVNSICMMFEGFEINYAHVKLIPVYENKSADSFSNEKLPNVFFTEYAGYITTLNGPLFSRSELNKILNRLK